MNIDSNGTETIGTAIDVNRRTGEVTVLVGADPPCPKCRARIGDARDHLTGCPLWGMLPKHWMEG